MTGGEDAEQFDARLQEADDLIRQWQQGDILSCREFRHVARSDLPGTDASRMLLEGRNVSASLVTVRTEVDAVAIVSHTCELASRAFDIAPYLMVAPVIHLDGDDLGLASRRQMPQYAPVPWLDAESFADLTRIMTVERPVAAEWTRTAECGTSEEQRDFGRDLARHFGRFAFPDDFTKAMRALRNRIIKKEPTGGAEGLALQRVCDIRAAADPDWLSGSIHVTITFLVKVGTLVPLSKDLAEAPPDAATVEWLGSARTPANIASRLMDGIHDASTNSLLWDALGHAWVDFCQPHGSIISVTALVIPFDEITVAEYLKTDRVDLEYLSSSVGD